MTGKRLIWTSQSNQDLCHVNSNASHWKRSAKCLVQQLSCAEVKGGDHVWLLKASCFVLNKIMRY